MDSWFSSEHQRANWAVILSFDPECILSKRFSPQSRISWPLLRNWSLNSLAWGANPCSSSQPRTFSWGCDRWSFSEDVSTDRWIVSSTWRELNVRKGWWLPCEWGLSWYEQSWYYLGAAVCETPRIPNSRGSESGKRIVRMLLDPHPAK